MKPVTFQYKTKDSQEWQNADAARLMFDLIPAGIATEYRVDPSCVLDLNIISKEIPANV